MNAQEGRNALDRELLREAQDAKEDLERALADAERQIAEARRDLAAGNGIRTSVTGGAMIVPENVNSLGTLWMDAERRRRRLLALYDETNGTSAEG